MTAFTAMPGVQSLRILRGSIRGACPLLTVCVHCKGKANGTFEPARGQVLSPAHHPRDGGEAPVVGVLDHERMPLEEREMNSSWSLREWTANVHTLLPGPLGRSRPQPKNRTSSSSTARYLTCW